MKSDIIYKLEGRMTADNAVKIGEDLLYENPDIIDAEKLAYISSAGLRSLLRLAQSRESGEGKIRIINVNPAVYEILEQTGFTEFFSVEKKLREVTAEGCPVIGKGYCATVYRLDRERIIKVYDAPRHAHDLSLVTNDREISKKIFMLGLPSLISYEVVLCDGFYAGIYELINGDTLGNTIFREPEKLEKYVRELAAIGRRMNSITDDKGDFPTNNTLTRRRERLIPWLSKEEMDHIDSLISVIPDPHRLVHGDYHVENVMVQNGELVMIDVGGFSNGHPVIDLLCLYMKTVEPDYLKTKLTPEQNKRIWECYIKDYFEDKMTPEAEEALESVLSLFTDLFMIPTSCIIASSQDDPSPEVFETMRLRLTRILQVTPETLRKHFEVIDSILYS